MLNSSLPEIRDLTERVSSEASPEYVEALREKMHDTSDLVNALVDLATKGRPDPSRDQAMRQCRQAETEVRRPLSHRNQRPTQYSVRHYALKCHCFARVYARRRSRRRSITMIS